RPAISWVDGAIQINNDYEINIPALFVPNVFSFATEGKTYRYGSIRAPIDIWAPWRDSENNTISSLSEVKIAVQKMLRPDVVLDILENFTVFATDKKKRKIKIITRFQQYDAANKIVERVLNGRPKKGLIWHFQGSGKSLLMVFAAQKLRMHPALKSPTVIIVVDRIDLDTQITATFNASDIPNTVPATTREELQKFLSRDLRKIIITTIHKFGEAGGVLNERDNIIVLVDEAHRTQEGDLGIKMREALPNAFLFGLTGTPINKRDRNTFWAFGAEEDTQGYMSRYTFEESIRDNATLPLHFEPRLVESHVDQKSMDEAFANITEHYHTKVEPNGFKAMVVCFDRKSCVLYKEALDKQLPQEASDIVMTLARGDDLDWKKKWDRNKDEEERILDRFRDQSDPLKILIVTSKLLTGFDAPILQTMYLDKLMKDHTLLQAVCRTNRPYTQKTHGLIVDYIGVFDDVAKSLTFDLKTILTVITNISELKNKLPEAIGTCLSYFPKVDKTISGYEGLMAAQDCLPNNEIRDKFAADYSYLSKLWEAISPDPILRSYKEDYRWLTQVYESVQPASGNGKLLWHSLGAKTIEIINENVHVDAIRDDLDKIVLDEEMIQSILSKDNPKKAKEIEIKIIKRLSKHKGNPKFIELGERLEELREKYELGFLTSLDFLNKLLNLARDLVEAEREVEPEDERKKVKAALTELFQQVKNEKTPIMVERVVNDIDDVVRIVRFDGWQWTNAGEREVKQALRKTLLKYKLHKEQDLFDRAYAYIRQYY
ncbi:MAG: DEAD/DEAH box helicase family protein, partial [Euryarchaeota archaeon]|nr:DEAD/DEAH box helicase family protein [Euryarchaeota archaeon]